MTPLIYGLDIETDRRADSVDPVDTPVVTVALSGHRFDELFVGPEAEILASVDARLAQLEPGVIATWNGSTFDLPFIADRARLVGVQLGLRLCSDARLTLRRSLLPGHPAAYRAGWHHHCHLDTFRLYGQADASSHWGSLRVIGRVLGLSPAGARVSTATSQPLSAEARHAHAPSDARLARVLAERRWSAAHKMLDRVDAVEARPVAVAADRLERQARLTLHPVATPA